MRKSITADEKLHYFRGRGSQWMPEPSRVRPTLLGIAQLGIFVSLTNNMS